MIGNYFLVEQWIKRNHIHTYIGNIYETKSGESTPIRLFDIWEIVDGFLIPGALIVWTSVSISLAITYQFVFGKYMATLNKKNMLKSNIKEVHFVYFVRKAQNGAENSYASSSNIWTRMNHSISSPYS